MAESNPPLRWQTPSATTFPDIDLSSSAISNKSNGIHNHTNGRDHHHSTTKRRAPLSFPATDTTITPPAQQQQQFQTPQQFQIVVKENGEPLPPPPPFSPPPPPGKPPLESSSSGVERESSVVSSSSSSSDELATEESCVKAPPPVAFHPRPWEEVNGSWRATKNDNDVTDNSDSSDNPPLITTSSPTPTNDTPPAPTASHIHTPLPPLSSLIQPGITNRNSIPLYPSRTALLIIDIQSYTSTPPSSSLNPRSEYLFHTALPPVLKNIKCLVSCFRQHRNQLRNNSSGCEIIWTYLQSLTNDNRDISLDYKLSGPLLSHIPTPHDNPATLFLPHLHPEKNDILLPKTSCSVFRSTIISYLLRNLHVEQLVICGQITNQCVESAVRDAADEGFLVTVVDDACAGYSKEEQEGGMRNMMGFARVRGTREVMEEMKMEMKVASSISIPKPPVPSPEDLIESPPVVSLSTITTVLHSLSLTGVKRLRIISISSSAPPQPSLSSVTIPLSTSETSKYSSIHLSSLRLSSHCKTMATVFSLGGGRRLLQRRSDGAVLLRRIRAVVTLTLSRGGDKGEFWDRLGDECRWQMITVDEMKEETKENEMKMIVVLSVDSEKDADDDDDDGGLLRLADDIVRIKEIMIECAERCDGISSSSSSVQFNPIQLSFPHHDINPSSQQQRIKHCLSLHSDVISLINPPPEESDNDDNNKYVNNVGMSSEEAVKLTNDDDNIIVSIVSTVGPHFAMATLLDILNRYNADGGYDDADGGDDDNNVVASENE